MKRQQSTSRRGVRVVAAADLGALVREAREHRGWTQTALGTRIGASRFWVAAFERGKESAELGLALRAVHAVGLCLTADAPAPGAASRGRAARTGAPGDVSAEGAPVASATAAAVTSERAVRGAPASGAATAPPLAGAAPMSTERIVIVDLDAIVGTTVGRLVQGGAGAAVGESLSARAAPGDDTSHVGPGDVPQSATEPEMPSGSGSRSRWPARRPSPSDV